MSKRKRTDFEEGVQSAAGSKYGAIEGADGTPQPISYDDEVDDVDKPATPPGPYSYNAEKRQALYTNKAADSDERGSVNGERTRTEKGEKRNTKPQLNPLFGQKGAFPEPERRARTADNEAEDGEVEEDEVAEGSDGYEAWEYLRAVREEAESLPSIYRAPQTAQEAPIDASIPPPLPPDTPFHRRAAQAPPPADQVFYSDGACIARPRPDDTPRPLSPAQEAYYQALATRFSRHRTRFSRHRTRLRRSAAPAPPPDAERTCHAALAALQEPPPAAVAGLTQAGSLRLVGALDEQLDASLGAQRALPDVLGRWAWALLGSLADVGGLSSAEVGVVRDLAKRASWGMNWLRVAGGDELEEAKRRALGMLGAEREVDCGTMATLHLIVTVAGEFYGQRDLLETRLPWEQ